VAFVSSDFFKVGEEAREDFGSVVREDSFRVCVGG